MAEPKKPISEMTDEELKRFLFPKKVREELKRLAQEKDKSDDEPS